MVKVMEGWELLAVEWSFVAITLFMVATRVYVQAVARRHIWRELFIIIAWILFVAVAVCDILQVRVHLYNLTLTTPIPKDELEWGLKVGFAQGFFYKTSIYACKASLLFFYSDLSPRHMYFKTWCLIWVTAVLCVVGTLVHILLNVFKCSPVSLNWDAEDHSCGYTQEYFATSWAFHLGTDILVYAIPFAILRHMRNLSSQQKLGAALMFGVGFVNILTAALLLAFSLYPKKSPVFQGFHNTLFIIQQATAILVVCLPQMRLYWKKTSADIASRRASSTGGSRSGWSRGSKHCQSHFSIGSRKSVGLQGGRKGLSELEKGSLFEDTVVETKIGGTIAETTITTTIS